MARHGIYRIWNSGFWISSDILVCPPPPPPPPTNKTKHTSPFKCTSKYTLPVTKGIQYFYTVIYTLSNTTGLLLQEQNPHKVSGRNCYSSCSCYKQKTEWNKPIYHTHFKNNNKNVCVNILLKFIWWLKKFDTLQVKNTFQSRYVWNMNSVTTKKGGGGEGHNINKKLLWQWKKYAQLPGRRQWIYPAFPRTPFHPAAKNIITKYIQHSM